MHWGDKDASFSDETILATVYDKPEAMKGPYPAWDKDIHFVRSDDFFVKHSKLVACGNQIEVLAGKVIPQSIQHLHAISRAMVHVR